MRRTASGFTLMEMLVVTSIISMMAATLYPVLIRAKERGKFATCVAYLKQTGYAAQMYSDDWDGGWPLYLVDPGGNWPHAGHPYLEKYAKTGKTFICPDDYTHGRIQKVDPNAIGWEYFDNPAGEPVTSYAYHCGYQQLIGTANVPPGVLAGGDHWLSWQLNRWRSRFIVAACPWHRYVQVGVATDNRYKDLALRADGSVAQFNWPAGEGQNWEYTPYR